MRKYPLDLLKLSKVMEKITHIAQAVGKTTSKTWIIVNKHAVLSGIIATVIGGLILLSLNNNSSVQTATDDTVYYDVGEVPEQRTVNTTEEYSKLRKLAPGVQISNFQDLLGKESFVNELSNDVIEYVFVNPLYYVEAATDIDNNVLFYSLTTRKEGFNPKFQFGPWYVDQDKEMTFELGKTTYSDLEEAFRGNPVYAEYFTGVNWFYYFEAYYVGRPGNYQTFIFSTNQAGSKAAWPLWDEMSGKIDNTDLNSDEAIRNQDWIEYRESAPINTHTVTTSLFGIQDILELDKTYFGPSVEQVRLLD